MKKKLMVLLCVLLMFPVFAFRAEARDFGEWTTKFGFTGKVGNAAYLDDGAILEGFGGAWYSKAVTDQVGVKFQLNNRVEKSYNFIIGLMNQPGVGWNMNGKEAQGIVLQIRIWANKEGMVVDVFKVTGQGEKGVERSGQLNSKIEPMNTDHFISFYKKNGMWNVALDGGQIVELDDSGLNFDSQTYVVAGIAYDTANGTEDVMNLKMSIQAVFVDGDMPSSYYGDGEMAGIEKDPVVNGWQRVRGYGKGGADNGKALSVVDGKVIMEGYGGCAYTGKTIHDSVAVDFELNNFDVKKSYYFSFGLVNKEKVYYDPNGSESQGITVRITSFYNGQGMTVDVWYVSQAGTENLGTLRTTVVAKNMKHTLAIFKEEGKWYVGIDGQQKLSVDLDAELGEESYLCAGAASYKELKMSIINVYVDDEVTDKMKSGTLKATNVSTGASGKEYGPGGTSFTLTNLMGELRTTTEIGNLGDLLTKMVQGMAWYQWVLIAGIGSGVAGTIVFIVKERKKSKVGGKG